MRLRQAEELARIGKARLQRLCIVGVGDPRRHFRTLLWVVSAKLEVQVGRPVAVDRLGSQARELLAGFDPGAGLQAGEAVGIQVAVERAECGAVSGRVTQQHVAAVVEPPR